MSRSKSVQWRVIWDAFMFSSEQVLVNYGDDNKKVDILYSKNTCNVVNIVKLLLDFFFFL